MECRFHIQDPSDPRTIYLYEAIIEQLLRKSLLVWRGIFAFATGDAVKTLFVEDPMVRSFIGRGNIDLIVGLDAVTNVSAMQELSRLTQQSKAFQARVFINPTASLFHPKISHFIHDNGESVLIVGSGNLTSGGLRKNIEAFTIISGSAEELRCISAWDDFVTRRQSCIQEIGEEAFRLASQNRQIARKRKPKEREVEPEGTEEREPEEEPKEEVPVQEGESRFLIARVPAAGGRWHQIHYNKEVISDFFKASPASSDRVFLREVQTDGTLGPDEARPVVYSEGTNRNLKIEVAAKRGEKYPLSGKPIIVLREVGLRSFLYVLLMPGDDGYEQMLRATEELPSIGKGVQRVLATTSQVRSLWPTSPLI